MGKTDANRNDSIDPKDNKTVDLHSLGSNNPLLLEDKGSSTPIPIPSSSSPEGINKDLRFEIENKYESNADCTNAFPLERHECVAENDLPEEKVPRGKCVRVEASPAFNKTLSYREKGKEKVLSGGDTNKTKSKDEDSEESVESCNLGLLPVQKKRARFEKRLILGSKRVKRRTKENTIPTSQRSSFVNWISNMVQGSNRNSQAEEPALALALAPIEDHGGGNKNIIPYDGNHYSHGAGDMGFSTFFRSIYCPRPKDMELKATNENTPIGVSKELVLAETVPGSIATPVSCHGHLACADIADRRNSSSSETHAEEKTANDVDNKCDLPNGLMLKQQSRSQLGDGKAMDSTLGDDVAKGKWLASSCNSVDGMLAEVPKGMFDAIRKLRLSRMDILKWMDSHSSLSRLVGYFLRLRLGNWENGLGVTDYYAARISAEQREKHPEGSKRFISVNIGGKNCLVESRHISNQDFLEYELTAWWSMTMKSGGAVPSEDDLKVKFEERIRLGF